MNRSKAAVARTLHMVRKNIKVLLVEMTPNLPKQVKALERIKILVSQKTLASNFAKRLSEFLTGKVLWHFPGEVRDLCVEGKFCYDLLRETYLSKRARVLLD